MLDCNIKSTVQSFLITNIRSFFYFSKNIWKSQDTGGVILYMCVRLSFVSDHLPYATTFPQKTKLLPVKALLIVGNCCRWPPLVSDRNYLTLEYPKEDGGNFDGDQFLISL